MKKVHFDVATIFKGILRLTVRLIKLLHCYVGQFLCMSLSLAFYYHNSANITGLIEKEN